jgi:hypothetical protein
MADEPKDEAMRLAEEMAHQMRKVVEGLGLTQAQIDAADEIAVHLGIAARQLRFDHIEKHGSDLPSLIDAASLALAFIGVDYRERIHRANPIPPPPDLGQR